MFKCPKCGFEDSPIWKASKWRRYSVYCNREELEGEDPDLLGALSVAPDGWVFRAPYWYKITKNGRVIYRMLEMGRSESRSHGFTERPKPPRAESLDRFLYEGET